jgi:hypothetical protein
MATIEGEGDRRRFYVMLLLAGVLIPLALGSSGTIFNDGDVSWQIATGRWILENRAIPHADPFSFTAAGTPWVPMESLAEVMLAGAYQLGRYSGVAALVSLALVALHLIVFLHGTRFVRPMAMAAGIIAMDVVLIPMMLARPHLLAWPLLAGWTVLMLKARDDDRAPPLAAVLLIWVWANLHGSFVMGLAIAGAFGLEALVESPNRIRALRQWALFGALCIVAVMLNVNGIEGVVYPFRIGSLAMLPLIDEWKPSNPAITPFFFASLAAVLVAIGWKGIRWRPIRVVLLAGLLILALLQVRHQAVLAIVAALLLPRAFAERRSSDSSPVPPLDRRLAGALAGLIAILIAARLVMPLAPPENAANPRRLIAAVPAELRSQPVLNSYTMGGPLILAGIRPYIDGRGDMYGDRMVIDYKRISDGDAAAFARAVRRWDIRWTILSYRSKRLIRLLDASPQWRRLYADDVGVIHVRR